MADSIISLGVEKLWELVSQEYELFQGVEEQITELKGDLNMLMAFLYDADSKKQTRALARNCLEEIKEITYDAEDIIETFLLKGSGIKSHMKSLACFSGGRREIALEITSISKRVSKVIKVMQTLGIKSDIMDGGDSQAQLKRQRETRHTFSSEPESNLVGLEKNVDKLVEELVENYSTHGVSVTGLGGLGKTTLVRQVFNHDRVKDHFDGLAWVCVSQEFTRKYVWETILKNLSHGDYVAAIKEDELQKSLISEDKSNDINISLNKKISDMNEDELQEKLIQLLETKKTLIVFDDVWTRKDWDIIKPMFPERKAGWKVMLTSRNDDVHPQCVSFKPKGLTLDECWKLLQMIAFPKNDTTGYIIDNEMVVMAKEMRKHCGGLPLAVKVLGGLLAAKHTLRQWEMIYENIKHHIVGGISFSETDGCSVKHVLSLSFEGLPSYLKHSLLHLASYPEDHKISLEKVSYVLAAEGITKPMEYEGATIRDVVDLYIEELVKRNMVISERNMLTWRFETCQLHDLMREICLLKAKEEKFLQIVTDPACRSSVHSQTCSKSRRLVVYCTDTFNGERQIKNSKLRSLLFIRVGNGFSYSIGSNFMVLQLLRVLDLSDVDFKGRKLPSNIGKLIHLKYLSLAGASLSHLPSSLRNLKSLLYLNLKIVSGLTNMPNVFEDMLELRYLCLPFRTPGRTKLELGNLLKLEKLMNFSSDHSSLTDLHGMTRLKSLSIYISGKEGWAMETLSSTLSKLGHLENLSIDSTPFVNSKLPMLMRYNPKLPDVQHLPSHLTTISLERCCLVEDPMPILEKLLQLKQVVIEYKAFVGRVMVCSSGGFPQLHTLKIVGLEWLQEWLVEKGSMSRLHTLTMDMEPMFKKLPNGLRFITSLKELTLSTKERGFEKKVAKGGEDYRIVNHIPLIRIRSPTTHGQVIYSNFPSPITCETIS
ncbi:PREDICTED: putative disease resistance protein At1g59780 [Camelina sativa]|uniref:Disease resistance protein At1g59780 n=1 Tax=Camelina sativa TaxID=90675 RepID=A0ABM1R496_CAMSA|nr:PREDICTED: putative disease resistance protein At1g59780 [Camelina sativa]XP_019093834.1 PREDICTED: putative disease resistance protein At1g59780 [Camelina sativa]